MKKVKNFIALALISIFSFGICQAQSTEKNQMYNIHEDAVLPSMVGEYEQVMKEFMDNVKKFNIPDAKWITTTTSDLRYLYVMPISNMADLDNNKFWNTLSEKMGADKLADLFKRLDKCYNTHYNYIITMDKDLSYMPGGITQTPAGQDYRRFYYIHTTPQQEGKLAESMKAVKDMFVKKGSKMEYRVYRSGFGVKDNYLLVAIAAKDGADYEAMDAANNKLLGADAEKVFGDMMKNVTKFEEISGKNRPDLGYIPK